MGNKYSEIDPETFKQLIDEVREMGDMYKANVHPYSIDEYKQMKTYMSPDRKSGYAVKPDGELVSVHSREKGRGGELVKSAIKNKARKLDAYDIDNKLPKLYGEYGFDEIARDKYNPEYAEDLELLHKKRPDFVSMKYNPRKAALKGMTRGAKMVGKKVASELPLIGGITAALASGDLGAAIPILGEADPANQGSDAPGNMSDYMSPEEARRKALERKLQR